MTLAVSAWPVRRKLALALAIPLLLAATLGGLRVQGDLAEAANASASARQVTALRPAIAYVVAAERAMVIAVGGRNPAALDKALHEIAAAGEDLRASKARAGLTGEQRHQVDVVLDLSQALRGEDATTLSPGTWVAQLRQLQSAVTQLITTVVSEQLEPQPQLELLSQTLAGRFSLAMQQALVATERAGETGSLELFAELGVEGAAIDRLAGALEQNRDAVAALRTANAQRFRTVRTGGTDLGGPAAYAGYDRIIGSLQDRVDQELAAKATDARNAAVLNAAVTLAALLAAVLLAFVIGRLLLNPIRRIREGALAVAHARLPEAVARIRAGEEPGAVTPIDVTTDEEIGQLARAVDDLHRQAVVLASGEANLRSQVSQMFVTLSRRNTSLVNQQLDLIERLERDEEDPRRLESLFRLDHLAARMRRTADSLLILADAPPATAGAEGLTVSDALQAATSGVQDYQRVQVRSANTLRLADAAAADVIHLLTELVDNALAYSPPESTVTVGATGLGDCVVIDVADAGLGIPAGQLAKLNESLRAGGEVTPDTARRMGLFVVSRLARRHGITVALRGNDDGGTTATVVLPATVLPDVVPAAPRPPAREPEPVASQPVATGFVDATPAAAEPDGVHAMDIEARINAALGLSRRVPVNAEGGSGAPTPVTPDTAAAALAALRPLREEPGTTPPAAAEPEAPLAPVVRLVRDPVEPEPEPDVAIEVEPEVAVGVGQEVAVREAVLPTEPDEPMQLTEPREPTIREAGAVDDLPTRRRVAAGATPEPPEPPEPEPVLAAAPEPALTTEPVFASAPEPALAATSEPVVAPVAEPEPAMATSAELTAAPPAPRLVAVPSGALDGDWTDPGDDGSQTPIFASLRSAWLSAGDEPLSWRTSEIEAGWQTADQVAEAPVERVVNESGLPMRRPGALLVPGGVTATPVARVRDPEAVRARLAAHASGVSRGRAAAQDSAQKEAGSR